MGESSDAVLGKWPVYEHDEVEAVRKVLESGLVNAWTGSETKRFEEEFADWCGTKYAIAHANGTVALHNAYKAIGLQNGDELITTPRSFIATASSAASVGARILFADVDINSGCITPETIRPLISSRTKAISVVHIGGWPARIEEIVRLAHEKGIWVIEDCAQAHGARVGEVSVGSFGDIGVWSFCQDKIISTGGEGGMITTSNKKLYRKMWSYKDHGKDFELVQDTSAIGVYKWVHQTVGMNYRMTEMQSAIGRIQLVKLRSWHKRRTENAKILIEQLQECSLVRIPEPEEGIVHAWYKFYMYLDNDKIKKGWSRERIIEEIISFGYVAYQGSCSELYLEGCFKEAGEGTTRECLNSKELGKSSIMLCVHPTITASQIKRYGQVVAFILKKAAVDSN